MSAEERRRSFVEQARPGEPELELEEDEADLEVEELQAGRIQAFLQDRRKLATTIVLTMRLVRLQTRSSAPLSACLITLTGY